MTVTRAEISRRVRAALLAAGVLLPSASLAQTPLTLEEAMARARASTPEARALDSAVGEADARVRQARSGYLPTLDVSETVQRGNQPVYVFSALLSQRRFTDANFAVAQLNQPDAVTNTRTAITFEQPIFNAGMTRLAVQAATIGRDLAVAERERGAQDQALRAAEAFVRVLQAEAEVRATVAAVTAAESDLERARARREVGVATQADVLSLQVHLADVDERQIRVAGDLAAARIRLAEAVGLPLGDTITLVPPAPQEAPPEDLFASPAWRARVERRQAVLRHELAGNVRRTARAAFLPTLGVQAGYEFNGSTFLTQRSSWVVAAQLQVNLFRGFGDAARIAEARHAEARAAAEVERIERQIEVDARVALAHLAAARARQEAGRAALAQARESQRIIRDRYESGLATVTDVLRAAEASLAAESRATSAEMDVILAAVALDRALGRL